MAETAARYPMLRGRRREARRRIDWRHPYLRIGLIALLLLGLLAGAFKLVGVATRPDARTELATAIGHFHVGNYSAARNDALRVVERAPDWGLAQAMLARTYLALGEGVAAEGAIDRAMAHGFAPARTHHLRADAWRLQGMPDRAVAEALRAPPRYRGYATRVRARALADQRDYPAAQALLTGLVERDPANSLAWSDLGRVRLAVSDIAGADAAAARAVAADRANLDALVLSGEIARSRYGLRAALPWFAAAAQRDRYYVPARLSQAATLGELGRNRAMLAATRDVLTARPGEPQALYLQAVLAARAGQLDLARAMVAKTAGVGYSMPGMLLLSGALDYAAGGYEAAAGKWRELVARQPMNMVARRLLGAALLRAGDAKGALAVVRPIALRPDADAYTLTLAGRAFEATGERDWAARLFARAANPGGGDAPFGSDDAVPVLAGAVADAPDDPTLAVGYVRGLLDSGSDASALARARALVAAAGGSPQAQSLMGDVLVASGDAAAGTPYLARAADLRFDAPALLRLLDAAARTGRPGDAARALALYLAQNPGNVTALRCAAAFQLAARDWNAARMSLTVLHRAVGDGDVSVLAGLAVAYAGAGDAAAATRHARAAYRLAPMSAATSDAYGWARYQAGDLAAARQLLAKASAIAPGDSAIRWHHAQVLAEAGEVAAARTALARLIGDPRFPDRAAAVALNDALA